MNYFYKELLIYEKKSRRTKRLSFLEGSDDNSEFSFRPPVKPKYDVFRKIKVKESGIKFEKEFHRVFTPG